MFIGICFVVAGLALLFMMNFRRSENARAWDESGVRDRFRLPSFAKYRLGQMAFAVLFLVAGMAFFLADILG
jgi:hypothetical protein